MSQRGSSLTEVMVAAAIGAVLALGLAGFFFTSLGIGRDAEAQAALQRQATAIADELGQRLRLSDVSPKVEDPSSPPEVPACLPLPETVVDIVLAIPYIDGSVTCFYRESTSPPYIARCTRPTTDEPCGPAANLLSGSLVPLFATAWSVAFVTPCGAAGGTCDGASVCSVFGHSCEAVQGASIAFTLTDGASRSETFGVTMVGANRH